MTKIFALSSNVKEGDEPKKLEGIKISSTTPQAAFYPVTLPISSIVAKKRCGTSHIAIILLSLITISFIFYVIPDFFYKKVHHLVSNEVTVSGSTSSWIQRPGRHHVAEEDTRIIPKLDSSNVPEKMNRIMDQNVDMMQNNRITEKHDGEVTTNDGARMKQSDDLIPNRFEAMKAIATLLKIPGVQKVAVVQNNGIVPDNMMMKPEIIPAEKRNNPDELSPSIILPATTLTQPQLPLAPQTEMKEWELVNYRRAIREWLLRREMFRRRMLAEMERGLQLQEPQELPQVEPQQSMLPIFPFAQMHPPAMMLMNNMQPLMEANQRNMPMIPMISPPMIIPRIPPMHPYMIPKQQPAIMPIKLMPPQMMNREEPIIQPVGSNPGKPSATPLLIRDDTINRLDLEQKKIPIPVPVVDQSIPMTLDGTPDRDTIFKELLSRAQMQQQMSQQNVLPAVMVPPLVSSVVPPAQINSDEIFRELQHRALRMQIEQDRLEAEQQAEKEKNVDTEIPVLMIADTFPRRPVETVEGQTSEEIAGATAAANIEATTMIGNSGNSSESLSTFNFFDKGIHENESTNSPDKEQEITMKNDGVKVEPEHSFEEDTLGDVSVAANEGVGLIVKPDNAAPQINFIQESTASETPINMDNISEEAQSKLLKPAVFQGESDAKNGDDMLGSPIKLLETPQIQ